MRALLTNSLLALILTLHCVTMQAQQTIYKTEQFQSSADIFGTRNFVENTGVYVHPTDKAENVLFVYECSGEKIYFTKTGITYELVYVPDLPEHEKEELEEKGLDDMSRAKKYFVQMKWQQANTGIEIEAQEKQSHYFTYGAKELNASAFKKLVYKNVYPNIDVVYEIPKNKTHGIKYSLLLHPGADVKMIDMLYSGDIKRIKTNEAGDVIFKTPLYDITEHAPESFYANGKKIKSKFRLAEQHLKFVFDEQLESNQEIIIDPWITALTTLSNDNNGFDVDFDFSGNTFVYGGNSANTAGRCKVAKYNNLGILQWTFTGIITTPAWNSGVSWSSNFKVNRGLGKTYVSRNNGVPNAIRLNAAGNYDNWVTFGPVSVGEVWAMDLICNGDLLVFGGASTSGEIVSTQTGSITLVTTFSPSISGCCQDIVSYAIDATGDMFVYFLGHTQLNHKVGKLSQTFTTSIWHAPSGYSVFQYLQNKTLYVGGNSGNAIAFNALAVNMNYLYYYDGFNVAAYNKTTGAMVGSTTIAGQTGRQQGGIAVDECNNVYVGGIGSIKCFNFNGTNFSTLTPIPLSTTLSNQYIYDIALNSFNNTLFVTGSGLVGSYAAIHSTNCPIPAVANPCNFGQGTITAQSTSITCANLGSATVTAIGGLGPFTYTWLPSMITGSTINGVGPGTNSVIVTDQGANFTYTAFAIFTPLVPMTGQLSSSGQVPCFGMNTATASVINLQGGSGNQSYFYTNGVTTQTTPVATNLAAGNYTAVVTDSLTGCVVSQSFSIYQPPQLSSYILASSPTLCVGDSVSLSNIVSGGAPSYSCSWVNGPANFGAKFTTTISGPSSFTVLSADGNQCTTSAVATITFVPLPSLSAPNVSICPLETGTITAFGASTYTWNGSGGTSTFTDNPLSTTVYTLSGSALGCSNTTTSQIILKPTPTPGIVSNSPLCEGSFAQLIGTGGSSYVWTGPLSYTSAAVSATLANIALNQAGVYMVTVTAANNCTASTSSSFVVNQNPVLAAAGSTVCTQQTMSLSSVSTLPVSYFWYGANGFSSSVQNPTLAAVSINNTGNYTVLGTTSNGCTNTAVAQVSVTPPPSLTIVPSSSTLCAQAFNGSANTITLYPSGAIAYSLYTTSNSSNLSAFAPFVIAASAPFAAGIAAAGATLHGSNGVCTSTSATTFSILPNPVVSIVSSTPQLCEGLSYSYQVFGATSYSWNAPTTGLQISPTGNSAIANPTVSSVYSVVGSSLGCLSATANTSITVYPTPAISISADSSNICLGTSTVLSLGGSCTSYYWSPPFGLSSLTAGTVTARPLSNVVYTIIGAANGCTTSITSIVNLLSLPQPTASSIKNGVCIYDDVELVGSGGEIYWWKGPNYFKMSGQNVKFAAVSPAFAGNYTLVAMDQKGCIDSTQTGINIFPLPSAFLQYKADDACVPYCPTFSFVPSTVNSAAKGIWTYAGKNYSDKIFKICFRTAGQYTITGQLQDSITGCKNTSSLVVEAFALPIAEFDWLPKEPKESFDEVKFVNKSVGASGYVWQFKDETSSANSTRKEPMYTWMVHGQYPVALVVSTEQGCSDTVVHFIKVLEDFTAYVPNTFTPNGDDLNDVFIPVIRAARNFEMHIYNRWGDELYSGFVLGEGWDGSFNGKPCKEDVYTWTMGLTTLTGERITRTGQVTLVR